MQQHHSNNKMINEEAHYVLGEIGKMSRNAKARKVLDKAYRDGKILANKGRNVAVAMETMAPRWPGDGFLEPRLIVVWKDVSRVNWTQAKSVLASHGAAGKRREELINSLEEGDPVREALLDYRPS